MHNDASESYIRAFNILSKNAPFISKELFHDFNDLIGKCGKLVAKFLYFKLEDLTENTREQLQIKYDDSFKMTLEISNDMNFLIDKLRDYIEVLTQKK